MATQFPHEHRWYTPEDCAALLSAVKHGASWRGPCPVHGGDSTTCLSIREVTDRYGHPKTSIHCFAHDCAIEDICAAIGIQVWQLYSIQPDYAKATRSLPRAHSPRIDKLKGMAQPTPDDVAQIMLEEFIVTDPEWIQACAPARRKMWELAQASPHAHEAFTKALVQAGIVPGVFWQTLARTQKI
jgi:hypothetical protein